MNHFAKTAFISAAAAVAALAAGCRKTDVKDLVISVPALEEGSECDKELRAILWDLSSTNHLAGVVNCEPTFGVPKVTYPRPVFDYAKKTVSLSFESLSTNTKNIEFAIAMRGWEANGVTPESVGWKPPQPAPPAAPMPKPAPGD